ncbi:MAG TPA: hypothetical protein VGC87_08725 [Pyrinomonadaceae bacterium]|jgi:hypothetical protein
MRNPTRILSAALFFALAAVPALAVAQQSVGALERGYRTGYSDGYQAGYRDSASHAARDYRDEDDYQRADRAYAASYGSLEDYRDGYQQGFEVGYDAGYDRHGFDSTIPQNISRRGTVDPQATSGGQDDDPTLSPSTGGSTSTGSVNGTVNTSNITLIPAGTEMRVELLTNLSSDATQKDDPFEARVVGPPEYQGAMIEGHVSRVKRAGKVKGNSELQLTFDKISSNGRWAEFRGQIVEVEDNGASEGVGDVDEEGGVKGRSRTKDDVAKVGASAGVGAIIGAIFGGGKGAAIGAVLGGAVGTGGVLTSRGKDIRLEHGQYLRIRTANETRF